MAKGSSFERDACNMLSEWWTGDAEESIFWRSTTSGARATTRGKKGLKLKWQHGDVAAIDPIGAPLIRVCTIELKRGYSKSTIHELADFKMESKGVAEYAKWLHKAVRSYRLAGSYSWALISRRDRRTEVIFIPLDFYERLVQLETRIDKCTPQVRYSGSIKAWYDKKKKTHHGKKFVSIIGFRLDRFLQCVKRKHIMQIAREHKRRSA